MSVQERVERMLKIVEKFILQCTADVYVNAWAFCVKMSVCLYDFL